ETMSIVKNNFPVINRKCLHEKIQELTPFIRQLGWGPTNQSHIWTTWDYYGIGCDERRSTIHRRIEQNTKIMAASDPRRAPIRIDVGLSIPASELDPMLRMDQHVYQELDSCIKYPDWPASPRVISHRKHSKLGKSLKSGKFVNQDKWIRWKYEEHKLVEMIQQSIDPYLKEELNKKVIRLRKLTQRRPVIIIPEQVDADPIEPTKKKRKKKRQREIPVRQDPARIPHSEHDKFSQASSKEMNESELSRSHTSKTSESKYNGSKSSGSKSSGSKSYGSKSNGSKSNESKSNRSNNYKSNRLQFSDNSEPFKISQSSDPKPSNRSKSSGSKSSESKSYGSKSNGSKSNRSNNQFSDNSKPFKISQSSDPKPSKPKPSKRKPFLQNNFVEQNKSSKNVSKKMLSYGSKPNGSKSNRSNNYKSDKLQFSDNSKPFKISHNKSSKNVSKKIEKAISRFKSAKRLRSTAQTPSRTTISSQPTNLDEYRSKSAPKLTLYVGYGSEKKEGLEGSEKLSGLFGLRRHRAYTNPFGKHQKHHVEQAKHIAATPTITPANTREASTASELNTAKSWAASSFATSRNSRNPYSHSQSRTSVDLSDTARDRVTKPLVLSEVISQFMKTTALEIFFDNSIDTVLKPNALDRSMTDFTTKKNRTSRPHLPQPKLKKFRMKKIRKPCRDVYKEHCSECPPKVDCSLCHVLNRKQSELQPYMLKMIMQRERLELRTRRTQLLLEQQERVALEKKRSCVREVLANCYQTLSFCRNLLKYRRLMNS
ncbi:hypothetical protein KR018_009665, partial [Drosophila ironensis]